MLAFDVRLEVFHELNALRRFHSGIGTSPDSKYYFALPSTGIFRAQNDDLRQSNKVIVEGYCSS